MNDILELVQQFAGQQDEPFDRGQPVNSSDIAWIGQKAAVINARHFHTDNSLLLQVFDYPSPERTKRKQHHANAWPPRAR